MSISIDVCFPVLNQEESTQKALDSFKRTQKGAVRYLIVDNGSRRFVREWLLGLSGDDIVIKNTENVGLPKAMNQARAVSTADYILFTHTDVEMFEEGWDEKIIKILDDLGSVGVAGFFGARGIGTNDIYKMPYQMNQLVRIATMAGTKCRLDPRIHGHMQFPGDVERCAVLDGFSLIVKNGLKFWNGTGPHHMYDASICMDSIKAGWQNIVINMDVTHYGGRTDVNEDWATPFGKTKAQVHADAHPPFYERYRDMLPYRV